jgi:c-di-GMP-binding flagellar brake protein YcgR
MPGGRERRARVRHTVDSTAAIILVNGGRRFNGRIQDVSLDGCRICSDQPFLPGVYIKVETEFRLVGSTFQLDGVVQMIRDRLVGIRFLDLGERQRKQLAELIVEIERLQTEAQQLRS